MKNIRLLAWFLVIFNTTSSYAAMDHSAHRGGSSKASSSTAANCEKPHLSNFVPVNMATVAAGSEVSFRAINIPDPEQQVTVTVKKIPVEIIAEYKEPFYVIKAKLPTSLHNTVARIDIKVSGKASHCETEGGWLVKIAE